MRIRKLRIPKITTVAMLALIAAGCSNDSDAGSELSTEVNLTEDSAANDALGANAGRQNQATELATNADGAPQ